jgi:hypothetical protein
MVIQVTGYGEEHGLLRTIPNSCKEGFKGMSPEDKAAAEKEKKNDAKMVKCRYFNRQSRDGILEKPYCRYAGEPIQIWKFLSDYEYTVPYGLFKEVNDTKRPKRDNEEDSRRKPRDSSPETIHELIAIGW